MQCKNLIVGITNVIAYNSNSTMQLLCVAYILKYSVWIYNKVLFALGHFKLGYEFTKVNDTTIIKIIKLKHEL